MGYFEDIEVFERRKLEQLEKSRKLQDEKREFMTAAIPTAIDILREFAAKAPDLAPHKFVLTPTHRRRYSLSEGTTTYRPIIEMPDVMQVRFGVSLERLENDPNYWNEVFLDKSGRYHCCESVVVPNVDDSPRKYRMYKGFVYERNLAKAILEAYIAKHIFTHPTDKEKRLDIDEFVDFLVEKLETYLTEGDELAV